MTRPWEADHAAGFHRRLGKTAAEVGDSRTTQDCPEIWELDNGDIAVIGRDATGSYSDRLPPGVSIGSMSVSSSSPDAYSQPPSRTFEMLSRISECRGDLLDHAAYHSDFARQVKGLRGVILKLERSQVFRELDDPSWQAFASGNWQFALDLLEEDREAIRAEARNNKRQGLSIRRVRVVEHPMTPYVQWELYALRMLAEEGFELNVLAADELAALETHGQLPEVVVIDKRVLYEVRYLPDWTPCGARRITTPYVIHSAAADITRLFAKGEPLLDFFEREVAPLPAPAV